MNQQRSKGDAALSFLCGTLGSYNAKNGADYLVDWANSNASFSVGVFEEVVKQFRKGKLTPEGRLNRDWRKPAIFDVVEAYKRRMNNQENAARGSDFENCGICGNASYLFMVVGGDGLEKPKPIDPRQVKPLRYVTTALLPCSCERGRRSDLMRKYDDPRALSRLREVCGVTGPQADAFAFACRAAWEKETGFVRIATKKPSVLVPETPERASVARTAVSPDRGSYVDEVRF